MSLTPGIAQSAHFYLYTCIGQNALTSLLLTSKISQMNLVHTCPTQLHTNIQVASQRGHGGPLRSRTLFSTDWLGFCSSFVSETLCDMYPSCQEYHVSVLSNSLHHQSLSSSISFQSKRVRICWLGCFSDGVDEVLDFPN